MEYIDIFDENNNPIREIKEKTKAHDDGNFHRTAHIWIINDKNELLLQKRSASKKSHPNCWDISSAGHIRAGESVLDGAVRELKEELGVEVEENELQYIATVKSTKNPKNKEFGYIYLLKCNKKVNDYIFEDEEVSEVKYVYFEELEKMVASKAEGLLIHEEEYNKLFEYIRNKKVNEFELIKDIYNLHIKGFEGLDFNAIRKENYEIIYNPNIEDCYSNFISNFDVKDKQEFKSIIKEASKFYNSIDRRTTVYLIPFMNELYRNKENYFEENEFELISMEAWQIYNDFSKIDEISTNCKFRVKLELATNMKEYADCVISCYQTDDEDDPYGDLDDGYRQGYMNYKKIYNDINSEFYYIKVDNKIVGTTQSVYNNKIYGIYSLAINKDYRNKGIGKEVLKQQLQICKSKNINTAYLQTELGFYPNKMYKKFGFEDLCTVYYYMKK